MANDETPAGFLSRWSRRKVEVRQRVASDEVSEKSLEPPKQVGSPDQEGDQKNLAVFDPGQIKSAIGNNGDFRSLFDARIIKNLQPISMGV